MFGFSKLILGTKPKRCLHYKIMTDDKIYLCNVSQNVICMWCRHDAWPNGQYCQ